MHMRKDKPRHEVDGAYSLDFFLACLYYYYVVSVASHSCTAEFLFNNNQDFI